MATKTKTVRINMGYRRGSYCSLRGAASRVKLCADEVKKFTNLTGFDPFDLVLTNKQPRGVNFHILKYNYSDGRWKLRKITRFSPHFYQEFENTLKHEFGQSATVYAWIEQ